MYRIAFIFYNIQDIPELNVKPIHSDRIDYNHHEENMAKFYPMQFKIMDI